MFDFIRTYQMDIMALLCGACGAMACMLCLTRFLAPRRKKALVLMEVIAFFLLWFDRLAYMYAGDVSHKGYIMVRVSNFFVFFLTSAIVMGFNIYLTDRLLSEGGLTAPPIRLRIVQFLAIAGMILAIISAMTNLYYYFDASNTYHRGRGFLIAYIVPVIAPVIQYTVIRQYRRLFSRLIYISMLLYIFLPITCGIIQIFTYGISIVNMTMVLVSVSLYIFTYLDINDEVEHAHRVEMEELHEEQKSMKRLFGQTSLAFVTAVEKRDSFENGIAAKVAGYARQIAKMCGKSEDDCDMVYYSALLHDVGMIAKPDEVIRSKTDPEVSNPEIMHSLPEIGADILSNIAEYPYLSQGAYYSHERYDGSGYPEGLRGDDIPEIARIIAVADEYVNMSVKKRYRNASPEFLARETFVKEAGGKFDPVFAKCMVKILDLGGGMKTHEVAETVEKELLCGEYRDSITKGVVLEDNIVNISFNCAEDKNKPDEFSAPSIILYDSYDRNVHGDRDSIEVFSYYEYGEIWFDNNSVTTFARDIREMELPATENTVSPSFVITAGRYKDHLKIIMRSPDNSKEVTVALQSESKAVYIALTGEHCRLYDISVEETDDKLTEKDIVRIADEISYIDRMESDLKNIQIDRPRQMATRGVEIRDRRQFNFHTVSLPGASLVWHCPYIVLFNSDDGTVNGDNYKEYAMIKLNGEDNGSTDYARNSFIMKKTADFPGWEEWKERNKEGLECKILFERKGKRITTVTENLGIHIENVTEVKGDQDKVYAALTGDQCALTDIRVH